ncbi:MAG: alpha/beta hydrolase [Alphaproteobacteria bacterium]|nr:alpha/beta hydrolase [Alphaproteobacteria bacterium]
MIWTFLAVYAGVLAFLYVFQRSMIYHPDFRSGAPYQGPVNYEPVSATTSDGLSLRGFLSLPKTGYNCLFIWFQGNAGTPDMRQEFAESYATGGCGVLITSYRGYAGNKGSPSEEGIYDDARGWIDFAHQKGFSDDQIILIGESLGTGVAVQMATEYPGIKGLILNAPYTSLVDVAQGRFFFVPVKYLMKDVFDSLSKISQITIPVLIAQGDRDRVIPPRLGKILYAAAPEPKKLRVFQGYGHNDMPQAEIARDTYDFFALTR